MPQYLDNIWGDEAVVRGFGNALNANFAGLVEARARQRQMEQKAAMDAAYLALERQKFAAQQPEQRVMTDYHTQLAKEAAMRNNLAQQRLSDTMRLRDAVMQQYMMAHPAMQATPEFRLPMGSPPMTMQSNMLDQRLNALPQQIPSTMPTAPTLENLGRINAATINSILAAQASESPASAERLMEGGSYRPGDVPVNLVTGQMGPQIPGLVSPYQQQQLGLQQQGLGIRKEQADTAAASVAERERHNKEIEQAPSIEEEIAAAMRAARLKRSGGGSGGQTTAMPKVGEVRKGYRFKGGDPAQQSSWEKVN